MRGAIAVTGFSEAVAADRCVTSAMVRRHAEGEPEPVYELLLMMPRTEAQDQEGAR